MRTASRPHLFLTDRGSGEPVLLITGWTVSSAVFGPVADHCLPHLRVIAYDHRGTGRSAVWRAPVSSALLAADAARVLDDRGLESAHVVGLSMGAAVALELAIRMPSRVKSLVLVGGGVGGPAMSLPAPRAAAAAIRSVVADTARHRRLWPAAALFSARFRAEHPDLVAAYVPAFGEHRAPPWAIVWQTLAVSCFARGGSLGRVHAPTLVFHGSEDVMSPADNARRLADGIPGAELHLVEGAGHAVPLEHPEASARLLVDWVTRHAEAARPQASGSDMIRERITRPWSLPAGALRNTRDATVLSVGALRRDRLKRVGASPARGRTGRGRRL